VTDMATETRRTLLKRAGVLGGALTIPSLLAACGSSGSSSTTTAGGAAGNSLRSHVTSNVAVFADYGGGLRDARARIYGVPFTAETGAKLVFADADGAKFVLQAQRGRGQWDAYDADGFELIDYNNRGLLEKLPSWVNRSDLVDPAYQDIVSGGFAYNFCQAYNTNSIKGKTPESWADFWDTTKFPGKRAWPKVYIGTAEPALMADGVAKDKMYPLDLERAFSKMTELRSNMLFYESYAQAEQMLESGAAVMGLLPNGRVYDAQQRKAPIEIVWNEAVLLPWEGPIVPKGAPHADAMFALISVMADPKNQAALAKATGYAPTVSKAYDYIDDATAKALANSPEHKKIALTVDAAALSKQNADYSAGYTKWLGGA
jgi:putative spermidine/putrescine transport system substrate-binding protein